MATKREIELSKELKEILECSACFCIPKSAPIFQCERGHVFCEDCHSLKEKCTICSAELTGIRNRTAEMTLAK